VADTAYCIHTVVETVDRARLLEAAGRELEGVGHAAWTVLGLVPRDSS
jgi:hypothetical protein